MQIWLDTADQARIQKAKQMGILYGVTTNPTIVARSGLGLEDLLESLLRWQEGPVTAQVTGENADIMIQQGQALFDFSSRLVIKVPVTEEGLKTLHALSQKKIPTMATAVFEPGQVLLAASAGATYIAPYFSRIYESDLDGLEALKSMMRLLQNYRFSSKLLAASLRSSEQVRQCIELGADAVTLNNEVFDAFIENHAQTLEMVDRFSQDWTKAAKRRFLPL